MTETLRETRPELERRTRIHAALADPARLRMVDHLGFGDASPGELRALLGMPSNLLAHHLHTLERCGIVARHRSEADRRRSYLRLRPEALTDLLPEGAAAVPRVVFVCTANSARSQIAAALWQQRSAVPAVSAGTRPAGRVAPGALAAARRHGLPLAQARPTSLREVLAADDYVVTVCDHAHEQLAGNVLATVHALHWSIPDPVRVGTAAAFDAAYADLDDRITRLAPRLTTSQESDAMSTTTAPAAHPVRG